MKSSLKLLFHNLRFFWQYKAAINYLETEAIDANWSISRLRTMTKEPHICISLTSTSEAYITAHILGKSKDILKLAKSVVTQYKMKLRNKKDQQTEITNVPLKTNFRYIESPYNLKCCVRVKTGLQAYLDAHSVRFAENDIEIQITSFLTDLRHYAYQKTVNLDGCIIQSRHDFVMEATGSAKN